MNLKFDVENRHEPQKGRIATQNIPRTTPWIKGFLRISLQTWTARLSPDLFSSRLKIEREITAKGHFSFTEAQTAELFIKDTYKKYARIMIANRAFVFGARDIADDLIMGVMETSELDVVVGNSNPSTDYYEDYTEIKD